LAASLHLAFEQLAADDPAALALLRLAAELAPEPIPFTLFTACPDRLPPPLAATAGDPVAFAGITGLVRRRALARVGPDSLLVHRLVQAILRDSPISTPTEDDMTTIAHRLLRVAVPADPRNNPPTWSAWRQLLPHVLAATDSDHGSAGVDVAWLLHRAATYLHTRGEQARSLVERAFELYQRLLGDDHPDTLDSADSLTFDLRAADEYERARQLDEDILIRRRRVLGEDHPDTLTAAVNLASDLRGVGECERARQLYEDTLARCRRVLGEDDPSPCSQPIISLSICGQRVSTSGPGSLMRTP
jgi:Tetratricopeptide repeat